MKKGIAALGRIHRGGLGEGARKTSVHVAHVQFHVLLVNPPFFSPPPKVQLEAQTDALARQSDRLDAMSAASTAALTRAASSGLDAQMSRLCENLCGMEDIYIYIYIYT